MRFSGMGFRMMTDGEVVHVNSVFVMFEKKTKCSGIN